MARADPQLRSARDRAHRSGVILAAWRVSTISKRLRKPLGPGPAEISVAAASIR